MKVNLTANASISLDATSSKVWEALTNPKRIKQYMFGTDVTSDWKEIPSHGKESMKENYTRTKE